MPLCALTGIHLYDKNGKCICGERRPKSKENKVGAFEIGDKVIARRKDAKGNKQELHGVVNGLYGGQPTAIGTVMISYADWVIELVERPYKVPTEPGLYTAADKDTMDREIGAYQIFRLTSDGRWQEFGEFQKEHADVLAELERTRFQLQKLTIAKAGGTK